MSQLRSCYFVAKQLTTPLPPSRSPAPTGDEVKEMLDGLCAMLKDDVESELFHNCRTSALMLRQLFQQAEQWHLKLKVDVSELQSG